MKYIQLTQDKQALVDNIDYSHLNQWKWYYDGYAARTLSRKQVRMHRVIAKRAKIDCSKQSTI